MTSHEFAEWMAFYRVEPFGHDVDQFMIANLTAMMANARKTGKPLTAADFMPKWTKPADPEDEANQFRRRADGAMSTLAALAKSGGKQRAQQRPKKGKEASG